MIGDDWGCVESILGQRGGFPPRFVGRVLADADVGRARAADEQPADADIGRGSELSSLADEEE